MLNRQEQKKDAKHIIDETVVFRQKRPQSLSPSSNRRDEGGILLPCTRSQPPEKSVYIGSAAFLVDFLNKFAKCLERRVFSHGLEECWINSSR